MEVGHGGARPFYGLFQLDGSASEDIADLEQIKKPFHWTDATNPIQWQSAEAEDGVWIDVNEGESPRAYLNVPGALYNRATHERDITRAAHSRRWLGY